MDNQEPIISLPERFDALLVSTEYANRLLGKKMPGEVTYEESEQGDARRRLLYIERLAAQQKQDNEQAHAQAIEKVTSDLHDAAIKQLNKDLADGIIVTTNILNLDEDIATLLDILSTRACSVSKLEPVVAIFPWLQEGLLKIVNTAEHRRVDARGKAIEVETVRTALSFLGIDNLRKIIPMLLLKFALPQITDPFPQIKTRLLEYSLGVANTCACLAQQRGQPVFNAYVLGMLGSLGICATWRQFFKSYETAHRESIEAALEERNQVKHSALQLAQPSPARLAGLKNSFAKPVGTRIFEFLVFKRINLLSPWIDQDLPLAKTLVSAQRYAQLKMLIRFRLVEKEEVMLYLQQLAVTRKEIEILKGIDIFKLQAEHFNG